MITGTFIKAEQQVQAKKNKTKKKNADTFSYFEKNNFSTVNNGPLFKNQGANCFLVLVVILHFIWNIDNTAVRCQNIL